MGDMMRMNPWAASARASATFATFATFALAPLLALALLGGCERSGTSPRATHIGAPQLDGLGRATFTPSTQVSAARYFQQGLQLAYAFDYAEAKRAFAEAVRLDPNCAICYWGLAYVTGPSINRPERDHLGEPRQYLQQARKRVDRASPRERALITALAVRLDDGANMPAAPATVAPPADVCASRVPRDADPLDVAYARAMAQVAAAFPDDADIGVLHAEALLMLAPWVWWKDREPHREPSREPNREPNRDPNREPTREPDREPNGGTLEAIAQLERVLKLAPDHVGANHLLIHALEQSPTPQQALGAAERLPTLAPAAGHLVHMPAHIYQRLGRYEDAVRANQAAVAADEALARTISTQGYPVLSHTTHHHHFLWSSASLAGQGAVALAAAQQAAERAASFNESYGGGNDYFLGLPLFTRVRFADWDGVLATPRPQALYVRGVWHWARGIALARRGDTGAAAQELAMLETTLQDPELNGKTLKGIDELREVLRIGQAQLQGELMLQLKRPAEAVAAFRRAVELEDALESEEPPPWASSTRVALGSALLLSGQAREAEAAFRADLRHLPANGWALYGLAESLRRQGRTADAQRVGTQFKQAWRNADLAAPDPRY